MNPGSSTSCTSCVVGKFLDVPTGTCNSCNYRCADCSNAASCNVCVTSTTIARVAAPTCVCPANVAFFDRDATVNCVPCDSTCKTCSESTATSCLSCADG